MNAKLWPHSIMVIQTTVYHKNELYPRRNKTVINAACRVMGEFSGLNVNVPLKVIRLKLAASIRICGCVESLAWVVSDPNAGAQVRRMLQGQSHQLN